MSWFGASAMAVKRLSFSSLSIRLPSLLAAMPDGGCENRIVQLCCWFVSRCVIHLIVCARLLTESFHGAHDIAPDNGLEISPFRFTKLASDEQKTNNPTNKQT
jgi:hypothetical protein